MTESELTHTDDFSVGQILKAARLEQGLTLEQIAESLCIKARNLSLLENDLSEGENCLGYDVYILGFVRSYSQYLKLNPQEIVEKFKKQNATLSKSHEVMYAAPLPGRGMPSLLVLSLSLIMLAAIIIGWKWINRDIAPPSPPEIVVATTPPEPQEIIPVEEASIAIEPTTSLLETNTLQGELPAFEDKLFPTQEEWPAFPEKWLERQ